MNNILVTCKSYISIISRYLLIPWAFLGYFGYLLEIHFEFSNDHYFINLVDNMLPSSSISIIAKATGFIIILSLSIWYTDYTVRKTRKNYKNILLKIATILLYLALPLILFITSNIIVATATVASIFNRDSRLYIDRTIHFGWLPYNPNLYDVVHLLLTTFYVATSALIFILVCKNLFNSYKSKYEILIIKVLSVIIIPFLLGILYSFVFGKTITLKYVSVPMAITHFDIKKSYYIGNLIQAPYCDIKRKNQTINDIALYSSIKSGDIISPSKPLIFVLNKNKSSSIFGGINVQTIKRPTTIIAQDQWLSEILSSRQAVWYGNNHDKFYSVEAEMYQPISSQKLDDTIWEGDTGHSRREDFNNYKEEIGNRLAYSSESSTKEARIKYLASIQNFMPWEKGDYEIQISYEGGSLFMPCYFTESIAFKVQ